jgi:hypothetical protein
VAEVLRVTKCRHLTALKPADEDTLQRWPVSTRVNSSRAADDEATLIEIEAEIVTPHEIAAANKLVRARVCVSVFLHYS